MDNEIRNKILECCCSSQKDLATMIKEDIDNYKKINYLSEKKKKLEEKINKQRDAQLKAYKEVGTVNEFVFLKYIKMFFLVIISISFFNSLIKKK